ncbi:MAG: ABC transporter ATP-binding protein [Syntrophomonadaceae bacterium]|nr:ABC transporter ATP-binding protein [Syntrophomonadaceae bacterium]
MSSMELEIQDISKSLDRIYTLDKVSIQVKDQEFVAVLGPSGCGKSTLLNIVSGLIPPDQGRILIGGEDWTGRTGRVSYMQQNDLLLPSRNILDNVIVPLLLKGIKKNRARDVAHSFFADFGLEGFEGYYPDQLSGGMRQRAALLRTYLFASDILLLDEPFVSLDAITRRKMQLWLRDIRINYPSSVLFVTHDIDEALILADRVYVFSARPARVIYQLDVTAIRGDEHSYNSAKLEILNKLM